MCRHRAQGLWAQNKGKAVLLGIYSGGFLGNLPDLCLGGTGFSMETVGKNQSSLGETWPNPQGNLERENSEILHHLPYSRGGSRLILYLS